MSRVRKVYKKEDTFDSIFKDERINTLNKSGGKGGKIPGTNVNETTEQSSKKLDLTDDNLARLNVMENKINANLKQLNLNINNKPVEKKSNLNDIQFDKNFVI